MRRNFVLIKLQVKAAFNVPKNELLYSYSSTIISTATENLFQRTHLDGYFEINPISLSSEIPLRASLL